METRSVGASKGLLVDNIYTLLQRSINCGCVCVRKGGRGIEEQNGQDMKIKPQR